MRVGGARARTGSRGPAIRLDSVTPLPDTEPMGHTTSQILVTEAWTTIVPLWGLAAAWLVPGLARALPARATRDARRLSSWSMRQRIGLAASGIVVLGSATNRFVHPVDVALVAFCGLVLLTSSAVDLRTSRLPDRLTGLAFISVVTVAVAWTGRHGSLVLVQAALGGGLFAGVLEAVHRMHPAGMGRGDVKFAAVLGALLGVAAPTTGDTVRLVVIALLGAIVLTLVVAASVAALRRVAVAAVPFGPGLAAASWATAIAAW